MVYYDRENQRVYVGGWRLHHGLTGAILTAVGVLLMAHDAKDFRAWVLSRD